MREHDAAMAAGEIEQPAHALVVQPVAMQGREQAGGAHAELRERPLRVIQAVLRHGVQHEEADEAIRMRRHRDGHGVLVAGDAGDERGA